MLTYCLKSTSGSWSFFCIYSFLLCIFCLITKSEAGSCFKLRLSNGHCHNVIARNHISEEDCCAHGGFYVRHFITDDQYMHSILLHRSGIPDCHYACKNELTSDLEACMRIECNKGFACEIMNGQPFCRCSSDCHVEDYSSGPVCTTNFRQFRNRCTFIRERCRSMDVLLTEMDCSPVKHMCPVGARYTLVEDESLEENDDQAAWKVCSRNQACVIRAYSGKASCEDANWMSRMQLKLAINPSEADDVATDVDVAEAGTFDMLSDTHCLNSHSRLSICATNNLTYQNQCHLRRASILAGMEIRIAYMGPCTAGATCATVRCQSKGMTCRNHFRSGQPVCLDCDYLPSNCNPPIRPSNLSFEEKTSIAFHEQANEIKQRFGDPRWHGDVFTTNWPYVCGSNGKTYPNTCFMHILNCMGTSYIEMTANGACLE